MTGASGFVAAHLLPRLVTAGATPLALGPPGLPPPAGVADAFVADLREREPVAAAIADARPDAVIHLAAQSSAARSFEAPAETFAVNTLGTWHLLEAVNAHAPRARVLAVGTSEVYGPQSPGTRVGEDAPFRPVSPYALSKAAADAAAEAAVAHRGLDVVRTRSFGHTGPGQTSRFVIPAWAEQIAAIERGAADPVLRVGNLDVTRDLCDVRDVVDAYVALLERGVRGAAYNVCRGEGAALRDVLARLVALSHVPVTVEVDPARLRPADVPYLVGDPSRIAADTGWRASIPFERTLADVLEEWRAAAARG